MSTLENLLQSHKNKYDEIQSQRAIIENYDDNKIVKRNTVYNSLSGKKPYNEITKLKEKIYNLEFELEKKINTVLAEEFEDTDIEMDNLRQQIKKNTEELDSTQKHIENHSDFLTQYVGGYSYKKDTTKKAKTYTKDNFAKTFVGTESHHKWGNMTDFNKDCKEYHNYPVQRLVFKKINDMGVKKLLAETQTHIKDNDTNKYSQDVSKPNVSESNVSESNVSESNVSESNVPKSNKLKRTYSINPYREVRQRK